MEDRLGPDADRQKCLRHIEPPTLDEARRIVQEGEQRLAQRLGELSTKLPSWDPELDNLRITI